MKSLLSSTLLIILSTSTMAVEKASEVRLDEVAKAGSQVMPFSLEKTLHVFTKKDFGGVQQVITKDPTNTNQIELIREHLVEIAANFKQRDFSGPIKVHGENMPGLKTLTKAKPDALSIQYIELEQGAKITYSSTDTTLIDAIHQWFDAQLNDHARHAVMHRSHHKMHNSTIQKK